MKTVGGGARGRVIGALGRKCQYTKTPKRETRIRLMGEAIDILLGSERLVIFHSVSNQIEWDVGERHEHFSLWRGVICNFQISVDSDHEQRGTHTH